jgi:DNA-binding response OmpR family regulator
MVSTEGDSSDQKQAFAAGANAYMVKPSKPDELLMHVRASHRRGNGMNPLLEQFLSEARDFLQGIGGRLMDLERAPRRS